MNNHYLNELKEALKDRDFKKNEIEEILSDYKSMYQDALDAGKSDEEVILLLGTPKKIAKDLSHDYAKHGKQGKSGKIIALTPFISVIIFMVIGLTQDIWHPTWLIFLLIPITAILIETKGFEKWIALSPFVSVILFITFGTLYDLWNPGWLIFLSIPMLGITQKKDKRIVWIYELSYMFAIAFYLYMGYQLNMWGLGALGFILPFVMGILFKDIRLILNYDKKTTKRDIVFVLLILLIIVGFVLMGILLNAWVYAWQLFLLIPILAIVLYDRFRFVAISPFIAVIIFFSLGYFFNLWTLSWLAFLIIPIAGILDGESNE